MDDAGGFTGYRNVATEETRAGVSPQEYRLALYYGRGPRRVQLIGTFWRLARGSEPVQSLKKVRWNRPHMVIMAGGAAIARGLGVMATNAIGFRNRQKIAYEGMRLGARRKTGRIGSGVDRMAGGTIAEFELR